jgi:hypothetical protein
VPTSGWFSVDYNGTELGQVTRKWYHIVLSFFSPIEDAGELHFISLH